MRRHVKVSEVDVSVLRLQPGDVVVAHLPEHTDPTFATELSAAIADTAKNARAMGQVGCLAVIGDARLEVVREPRAA